MPEKSHIVPATFFSLFSGTRVLPGKKIVPPEEFQQLLSGKELIEAVSKESEQYKIDIATECEKIKEEAYKEGYQEGFKAWAEMVQLLEKEIARVRDEMQKSLMPIALKAAKKIVGAEIEQRPETILDIIGSTSKAIAQHKRIVIYVSKPDFEVVEKSKNDLKKYFEELESLSIRFRDDLQPGDCVIETEGGIINAKLLDRWSTLEAAFSTIFAQKSQGG